MRRVSLATVSLALFVAVGTPASASDLVYQPVNPNFGGDPFNSDILLGTARAQDDFEAPSSGQGFGSLSQDPAERFKRQLQSQLLGNLATEVSNAIFGTEDRDPQDSGTFEYDNITVDFTRGSGAVDIAITNTETGEVTQISVPTFATK